MITTGNDWYLSFIKSRFHVIYHLDVTSAIDSIW